MADPAPIVVLPPIVTIASGTDVDGNAAFSVPNRAIPPPGIPAIPPAR